MKCGKRLVLFSLFAMNLVEQPAPEVKIEQGTLTGIVSGDGSILEYIGIPYATVNSSNRFQAPYPAPKWEGTFKATEQNSCPQYIGGLGVVGIEDCLQANVYVPALAKGPLPVMVYIHGGAFIQGNGGKIIYGPDFIVKQDVILVTLNYRLEILGFLCLGIKEAPGNAGLKDQIAGLKWVQKNIAAFGGDPDNVTLFGESAGSGSVSALCGSDAANGLFKRAILQSGFSLSSWAIHQNPVKVASILAKSLGYNTENPHEMYKIFSKMPVEDLIVKKNMEIMDLIMEPQLIHMPCVEKAIPGVEPVISDSPYNLLSTKPKDIPVIYGTTSKEGWLMIPEENEKTVDKWNHRYLFGADVEIPSKTEAADVNKELKEFYFKNEKISMKHIPNLTDFYTDFFFEIPGILESEILLGSNTAPAYNYIFNYSGDRNVLRLISGFANEPGASHGDDLFYLFHALIWPFRVSEKDQKIIDWMTKMWTNFAKYGDPTPPWATDLPTRWLPSTKDEVRFLHIEDELKMGPIPNLEAYKLWKGIYKKYRKTNLNVFNT